MVMTRRRFLGAILAAGVAPAVVRASSLMRCTGLIVPLYAIHHLRDIEYALLFGNHDQLLKTLALLQETNKRLMSMSLILPPERKWFTLDA